MTKYALVGDVGGTNARLALCDVSSGEISRAKTYSGLDYPSLEAVVRVYLEEHQVSVEDGCIAIACPITGDWVAMTNHTWAFSIAEMKKNLGFSHLEIMHVAQRWVSLPGEGGHVDFAPNSEEEGIILEELRAEIGHVSAERVLSGPGLVNLYRAIVKSDGRLPENLQPKDVTERALADSCIDCRRALSLFCVIMGRFGGNLALTLGTFGGVYIAGGIVPRFLDFFKASGFRGGFEDKGRFRSYVQDIPVYLIVHDNPGLLGSGAHLRQVLGQIL
ncbi:MAG: glucokinase [Enterobacter asburiae]|nr:glucokinase [Enterobacter asburiae]